jgi:hypothetical protein
MANDEPTEPPDCFIVGWRLSRKLFERPEHVADVLKYFGVQRRSTLRKIIQELDTMAIDYRIALKNRPLKFEKADLILEQFEKSLLKMKKQWIEKLRPLHPAFITLRIKMISRSERKQKADAAMASIDLDLVATTLLRIVGKLRTSKEYAAAHHQPGRKSIERAFLWEPLLRLMKKYHAKPGQHGSFLGAIKSLHLAIEVDRPSEGAIKKMLHDLRQGARSKRSKGYATAKKSANALPPARLPRHPRHKR